MTAAQIAAQMAVDIANNQKSRCELAMDSVGLCQQFMLAKLSCISSVYILYVFYCKAYLPNKENKTKCSRDKITFSDPIFWLFPPSTSHRNGQSRTSILQSANHPIGPWGEAQSAEHINSHHSNAAHDATATSCSQSTAASPAPRTTSTHSATAATPTAAHAKSAHAAFSTAHHGKLW